MSDEKQLEPINDTLNPAPTKFGLPWYVILGMITLSAGILFAGLVLHSAGCALVGILFCPTTLGFGWWLCHRDPKEPMLILHERCLPSEFDPGK